MCLRWFWAQCDWYLSRTLSSGVSGGFRPAVLLRVLVWCWWAATEKRPRRGRRGGSGCLERRVSGSTAPTRRVTRPVIPPAPRETRETRFWPEEHTLKSHLLDLTSVSLVQSKKQFHFYTGTVLTRVLLLYFKYFWYFTVDPEVLLISDTYSSTIHMSDFHYSNSNILTTYLDF